jgi:SAM-dependent methyltransferase
MSIFAARATQISSAAQAGKHDIGGSVLAEVPCPVCAEETGVVVAIKDRRGRPLKNLSCVRCGLFRVDPLPSADEICRFHEVDYRQSYKGVRRPKLKHTYRSGVLAVERFRRLASRLGQVSRVLDIGCASGEWLYLLKLKGHSVAGIEADPAYAEFGRQEYGVEVRVGSVFDLDVPDLTFDCITMFHVLEHLPNPVAVLSRIHRWLKDDGVLVIEVPNMNSVHQNPAKRFHYAHVIGFTSESVIHAATRSGFEEVQSALDEYERNVFALFRKNPTGHPESPSRPPNPLLASTSAAIRYYLRPSTYLRWIARMGQFAAEFRATGTGAKPREILRSLARNCS